MGACCSPRKFSPGKPAWLRTLCLETGDSSQLLAQVASCICCRILPGHSPEEVRQTLIHVLADPKITVQYIDDVGQVKDTASDRRDIVTVDAPTLGLYPIPGANVSSPWFTFTRSARALPGHVEMDYRLRFLTGSVPPEDFERYRGDIERMDHNIFAWIDLDRDFSHRYYRDIPKIIHGFAAAVLLGAGVWWFWRRRRAGRA